MCTIILIFKMFNDSPDHEGGDDGRTEAGRNK